MLHYCFLRESLFISCGDKIAKRVRTGIRTPCGDFIYSRGRHDYVAHDGCVIDGGDAYLKTNGKGDFVKFKIVEDKMVEISPDVEADAL